VLREYKLWLRDIATAVLPRAEPRIRSTDVRRIE